MADPPTGAPEPLATTTTRRDTGIDVTENLAPTTTVRTRRHARVESEQAHAAPEPVELTNTGTSTGRVTTREIWQIIVHLQLTIEEQTTLIHATRTELREVKDNQNELQTQNEKLQEEIAALRSQVNERNAPTPTRSWAAVAASTDNPQPRETRRQTDKDKNCVRISTQRSVTEGAERREQRRRVRPLPPHPDCERPHQDGTVEDAIHPGRAGCGDWYYQDRLCDPIQKPGIGRNGPQQH
jgi:regulator of replication initiation timing